MELYRSLLNPELSTIQMKGHGESASEFSKLRFKGK